jgi:hypothetical protein
MLVGLIKVLGCFGFDDNNLIDDYIRKVVADSYPIIPYCDWNLLAHALTQNKCY